MRVAVILPIVALLGIGGVALTLSSCGGDSSNNTVATSATPVAAASPPAGKQWVDVVEKTAEGGYRMGNPDAPIKLVEYGSRSCPHCKRFAEESGPLRDKYVASGQVSYEFRDYLVHPQIDIGASLLGQCVAPDAFFPILDAMFASQDNMLNRVQSLTPEQQQPLANMTPQQAAAWWAQTAGYREFMMQHGMPGPKADACLADGAKMAEITKVNQKAIDELSVQGTPTFFINGAKAEAGEWAQLEPLLRGAGAR